MMKLEDGAKASTGSMQGEVVIRESIGQIRMIKMMIKIEEAEDRMRVPVG